MIERFFAYQFGAHQVDWEILGGVLALAALLWMWSACRLVARAERHARMVRRLEDVLGKRS
jgi:hypothetical protein